MLAARPSFTLKSQRMRTFFQCLRIDFFCCLLKPTSPITMFQYRPLSYEEQEIRILHLSPGKLGEQINCKLVHVSLDERPFYHALSYCWGSPNNQQLIILEGTEFSVTMNLFEAMNAIRSPTELLVIWIDAICINQQDLVDRSEQVKFMRRIYEDAAMVNVWLGPATKDSSLALTLIRKMGEGLYSSETAKTVLKECNGYQSLRALVDLFRREYWQRTWVIQEFSLAKETTIHCGGESVTRGHLESVSGMSLQWHAEFAAAMSDEKGSALDALEGQFFLPKDYSEAYPGTSYSPMSLLEMGGPVTLRSAKGRHLYRQGRVSYDEKPGLLDCLLWHRFKQATDPRDKVYGLAGLSLGQGLLQTADYGLPINQVYQNTVKYVVDTTKSLDIICASRPGGDVSISPSWMPDWRSTEFRHRARDLYYSPTKCSASGSSSTEATFSSNTTILTARGFFVDAIHTVLRPCLMSNPEDINPVIEVFHEWYDVMVQIKGPDMKHGIDFCRVLRGGPHEMVSDSTMAAKVFAAFLIILYKSVKNFTPMPELLMWEEQLKSPKNAQHWQRSQENYLGTVRDCAERMQGKTLFAASQSLGTGLHHTQKGDLVCILLGCSYPVILRRQGEMFKFVGEAYVEGLMLGAAMDKLMKDAPGSPFTVQQGKELYLDVLYDLCII
jgi:hypothetical protein